MTAAARKWIKEIVGLPTYIGSLLFGMVIIDRGFLATAACVIITAIIYNNVYELVFPDYIIGKSYTKMALVFIAQFVFWWGVFYFLSPKSA